MVLLIYEKYQERGENLMSTWQQNMFTRKEDVHMGRMQTGSSLVQVKKEIVNQSPPQSWWQERFYFDQTYLICFW